MVLCLVGAAQDIRIDSSFHNYLYDSRLAYFRQLPARKKTVVFFGDSITHWGDWAELTGFRKAINRGIAGDNTYGLRNRTDEVLRHQPSALFILIGTNDLNIHIPVENIISNYRLLVRRIKTDAPQTKIIVQSVLPINNQLIGRQYYSATNEQIMALNTAIAAMAKEEAVVFVDLYHALLDPQQQLAADYTYDGLHLSGKGYLKWIEVLKQHRLL